MSMKQRRDRSGLDNPPSAADAGVLHRRGLIERHLDEAGVRSVFARLLSVFAEHHLVTPAGEIVGIGGHGGLLRRGLLREARRGEWQRCQDGANKKGRETQHAKSPWQMIRSSNAAEITGSSRRRN